MSKASETANFLLSNRKTNSVVSNLPDSLYPEDQNTAHAVQDELVELLTQQHQSAVCGYKLACTNQPVMKLLGVDGPFSGQMMSHSMHSDGVQLDSVSFVHRVVELEFIFTIGQDVPYSEVEYNSKTIIPYIDQFAPGIEIVDHRFTDFTQVGGNALIADNAIHGACVVGRKNRLWKEIELSSHAVNLEVNDQVFSSGSGNNVLGNPLNVMAWLENDLQSRGKTLKSGDIVTTGTACDVYYANRGDKIRANFGLLGSVSLSFV